MRWINDEVERRLLSAIVLNRNSWHEISARFNPEAFATQELHDIAAIVAMLSRENKAITGTAVYIEARKQGLDTKQLLALDEVTSSREVIELNNMLLDLHRRRQCLTKLKEAVSIIEHDVDMSTEDIIATAQSALLQAFETEQKDVENMQEVLEQVYEDQLQAQAGTLDEAIPLSLDSLDGLIRLLKKKQVIIAARPSMGKSALAMNIIKDVVKRGRRVLLFTPEQSGKEFAVRALSAEADIPASKFGECMENEDFSKFQAGLSTAHQWPLRIVDRPRIKIETVKAITRSEKSRYPNLDLMVIDYLGECDVEEKTNGGLQQATGRAVSELRGLAKELDIAQIVVSQLSRSLESRENKRPQMSDLRETGRIEEVADSIIFLYRHGYYEPFQDSNLDGICEVHCAKERQGSNAGRRVLANLNRSYLRFEKPNLRWVETYVNHVRKSK